MKVYIHDPMDIYIYARLFGTIQSTVPRASRKVSGRI